MNQLTYTFDCLDGSYQLKAQFNEKELTYEKNGSIPGFEDVVGMLGEEKTQEFLKEVEEAGIEHWDAKYVPTGSAIEDAVKWSVIYEKEGKTYHTEGEETYEPYGYEHLIRAIALCEEKASYFLPGE